VLETKIITSEEAMFSSAVLDLAIGLVFCFLTVSLATGAVVEAISSITKWRAKTLRKGIGELLNDPQLQGLAGELYAHAAINPRGPGGTAPKKNEPAYIDRQLFANALMDLTGISGQVAVAARQAVQPADARPNLDALHAAVTAKCQAIANPQLQQLLTGIVERSFGDVDRIRTDLSTWFDLSMDRVSGAYKRWTQAIAFIIALILAVALNIDTVTVAKVLWTQPKLAEQLKLSSPSQAISPAGGTVVSAGGSKPESADMVQLLQQLNTTLPIGWPHGFWYHDKDNLLSAGEFGIALLGWLITALATLFGAPFWFDLLQTVIRLKGSGPSPKEKVEGKGAAA
jgi:hypothetical protein